MSDDASRAEVTQSKSMGAEIDTIADRFEAAWLAGEQPQIEDYMTALPRQEEASRQILLELVMIDLEHRWRRATEQVEQATPGPAEETLEGTSKPGCGRSPEPGSGRSPDRAIAVDRRSPPDLGDLRSSARRGQRPAQNASEPAPNVGEAVPGPTEETLDVTARPSTVFGPRLEDYVRRFPALGSVEKLPGDVIAFEYRVRHLWGDKPGHNEYLQRFGAELFETLSEIDRELLLNTQAADAGIETSRIPAGKPFPEEATTTVGARPPGGRSTADAPAVGTAVRYFGDYELLEEIARGGMGVVYKVRQMSLNRIVALKMILAGQLADEEQVKRFHAEAEAAANLDHPGIVPIYEIGEHEGQHYFSMGYVEGASLSAKVAEGPLPSREAAELTEKIAAAVGYAHEQGVIHRDLKPANVLLRKSLGSSADGGAISDAEPSTLDNQPMVTDFGLAKRIEGDSDLTVTGQILGTPAYMPPEQASGRIDEVAETADVYSLGAILYNLLTGRPPFQADNRLDTLKQVLEQETVSPRQLNPNVPQDLETICLKCLEKDRRKRYPTAKEMGEELRRFLRGEPIHARPVTSVERAWRFCKRKPVVSSLTAALVVTLVGGLVGVTWQWIRAEDNAAKARTESTRAWAASEKAETEAKRAADASERAEAEAEHAREQERIVRRNLYLADMNLAAQAWDLNNVGRMLDLLNAYRPGPGEEDLRGFEWYHFWHVCHRDLKTIQFPSMVASVAFSPDGKTLALSTMEHGVRILDSASGETRTFLRAYSARVAFSPDGKRLATSSSDRTIRLWDPVTGDEFALFKGHTDWISSVAFSPDDQTLASGSYDGTVRLWDLATEKPKATFEGHELEVYCVSFSPDGKTLASGGGDGTIRLWDPDSGKERADLVGDAFAVRAVSFSPDGKTLASGAQEGKVKLWDLATGQERATLQDSFVWNVNSVAFAPDGETLATSDADHTVKLWNLATLELKATFKGHHQPVRSVSFSPDGKILASGSGDGTVKLWDAAAPDRDFVLRGHKKLVNCVAFSPDGKTLVSGSCDNTVRLWDVVTGEPKTTLEGHQHYVTSATFSPDGRTVASGSYDQTAKLWGLAASREQATLEGHADIVTSVAFSPDGNTVATASGGVKLWERSTGTEKATLERRKGYGGALLFTGSIAFTPDGSTLAAGNGQGEVELWDTLTWQRRAILPGHYTSAIWSLAFSSDGKILASATRNGTVKLWNIATGRNVLNLRGHANEVHSAVFSPDGKTLASGSGDGTVRLWDAGTGRLRATLSDHTKSVTCVAFSPDGRILASASHDKTIRLWRTATEEDVATADP